MRPMSPQNPTTFGNVKGPMNLIANLSSTRRDKSAEGNACRDRSLLFSLKMQFFTVEDERNLSSNM